MYNRFTAALSVAVFCTLSASAQHYTQTNLVSSTAGTATTTDPNLMAPWGLSRSSGSPWWVSDAGSGLSTLYDGSGAVQTLVVTIPGGSPTGTVYNGTGDFNLPDGSPAPFLFCSTSGVISAWSPTSAAAAVVVVNNPGSSYTGLAIASYGGKNYLYATDFQNGRIDIFDAHFQSLRTTLPGLTEYWFTNGPGSADGFVPFNVQNIGGNLFVTFALPDQTTHFDRSGPGQGFVAAFTPQGQVIRAFQAGTWMNAPYGLALAPSDFGAFSHSLLVGNFGSGQIAAFNMETGQFEGMVVDANGNTITIDGLWSVSFGGGNAKSGPANALYFTAGSGIFGNLVPVATDLTLGNGN